MITFAVSEKKNRALQEKMEKLGIREEDFEEKFIKASGRGGQKVNKTSASVYVKHVPTGIAVKCMKDRSQSINRFLARRELVEKIEEQMTGIKRQNVERDKIRKRKSKKKKRAKDKYDNDNVQSENEQKIETGKSND